MQRDRVLAAVVACAGRVGIARITVDEVAREAGVGRATVYRWFPGGRDQLVEEGVTWEVGRFLERLDAAVAGAPDLRTRLIDGLAFAQRAIAEHEVLQRLLATDPGGLLPQLQQTAPLVVGVLRDAFAEHVPVEAAEWLARMFLSYVVEPGDLDPSAVADALLAGVV